MRPSGVAAAAAALAIALTGCSGSGSDGAVATTASTTTTVPSTSTAGELPPRPGLTRAAPLPQPLTMNGGWEQITIGAPELLDAGQVPALWASQLQPGQTWARVRVAATFTDAQATNGDPMLFDYVLELEGAKRKPYKPAVGVHLGPAVATDVRDRWDVLADEEPVVAGQTVDGFVYFTVDSNDSDLWVRSTDVRTSGYVARP